MESSEQNDDALEKKKELFLKLLKSFSEQELCYRFYKFVKECLEKTPIEENGCAALKFEFAAGSNDVGDSIFNIMYSTERSLKIGTGTYGMKYKYDPKTIDGVVYMAVNNPLIVEWNVNIGGIQLKDSGGENDEAKRKDSEPAKAD